MNPLSAVNFTLALVIVILAVYYYYKGRPIDKSIMALNALAGIWASSTIALIFVDRYLHDVFPEYFIRWLISVTLMVILGTKLMNLIRIGRRHAG